MIALATYEEGGPDEGPKGEGCGPGAGRAAAEEDADPAEAGAARPPWAFLEELGLDLMAGRLSSCPFPAGAVGADAAPCPLDGGASANSVEPCPRSHAACEAQTLACGRRCPARAG